MNMTDDTKRNTHTHTHTRTHARTHAHTHARTPISLYLSNMIILLEITRKSGLYKKTKHTKLVFLNFFYRRKTLYA